MGSARGGVVVAFEVAKELKLPLHVDRGAQSGRSR